MQKLYETYENCQSLVGVQEDPEKQPLMPIYHITQQAQVEAMIDMDGNWRHGRARVLVDKKERTTLIPCTERSAGVANGRAPHNLFDKLKYLAGDYSEYRDAKGSEYDKYMEQLSGWCSSPYAHPKVCAVEKYLKKASLMADLIQDGVLFQNEDGSLPEKWEGRKEETPDIFKACSGDQSDAFVRFRMVQPDGSEDFQSELWKDHTVWQSFIDYQNSLPADRDYCYVLGEKIPVSSISPKYIRRPGDGAKLVSSNDSSGFTYRGRFETSSQALCIGRETTEKAHNALKWLISKQAYVNEDQVILSWGTNGEKIIDPCADSANVLFGIEDHWQPVTTKEEFAARFRKVLAGYAGSLKDWEDACVMGLDSATPGRLSVFYYRELQPQDFVTRVQKWHETCSWQLSGFVKGLQNDGEKARPVSFTGAPSPVAIVRAAYGERADNKLSKSTIQRLLPCIVDGAALPRDLMQCAARRASNPIAMESSEAQRTLGVACALIRKYYNDEANKNSDKDNYKEVWKMELDPKDPRQKSRDFLFGRMLAYAQKIESYALYLDEKPQKNKEDQEQKKSGPRNTNAERMQVAFSRHPAKTWEVLYHSLLPYLQKLGGRGTPYIEKLNGIISEFEIDAFNNKPLNEIYLLGYACQMQQFHEEKQENLRKKNGSVEESNKGEENK